MEVVYKNGYFENEVEYKVFFNFYLLNDIFYKVVVVFEKVINENKVKCNK